jgi:hypothetical protein
MIQMETFLTVLHAACLTYRVDSAFKSRGGMLLVAPPGQMKTSMLATLIDQPGVMGYSDMTTKTLVEARDYIASKKVHTLLLYDFQKIYERKADTAANIVGSLRALVEEGFSSAAWEEHTNMIQTKARALVMAACTPAFIRRNIVEWDESGFSRRFLFCHYTLRNPEVIVQAIMSDTPIPLMLNGDVAIPFNLSIPLVTHPEDELKLRRMLRHGQRGEEVPLILLRKLLAVLRWRCSRMKKKDVNAMHILEEFSECMRDEGAEIVL